MKYVYSILTHNSMSIDHGVRAYYFLGLVHLLQTLPNTYSFSLKLRNSLDWKKGYNNSSGDQMDDLPVLKLPAKKASALKKSSSGKARKI